MFEKTIFLSCHQYSYFGIYGCYKLVHKHTARGGRDCSVRCSGGRFCALVPFVMLGDFFHLQNPPFHICCCIANRVHPLEVYPLVFWVY